MVVTCVEGPNSAMGFFLLMKTKVLFGIALFIGLPLIGWGLADVPGYFANPARFGYAVLIALIQLVAAWRFPEAMKNSGEGDKTVRRQDFVIRWLQFASLALVLGAPFCDRREIWVLGGEVWRYVGLALASPGFVLMLAARVALGRQFSLQVTIQEKHQLITNGLYARIRHPRYAGILLYLFGTALLYRSWLGLALAALCAAVLFWRIRDEERLLHEQFGAEWEAYCRRSARLVPGLF